MQDKDERPDGFVYRWVTILPDSMRFFLAAARHYQSQLERELERIRSDDLLSEVFQDDELASLDLGKESKRLKHMGDRLQENIEAAPDAWDYELTLRHREVRILKALGQFYLADLNRRRNKLAAEESFSSVAVQAIDSRISRFEELLVSGLFGEASPWPLLLDPPDVIHQDRGEGENPLHDREYRYGKLRAPARIISKIEILDTQLRERCLDLLDKFDTDGEPHRYDTVITEATRILEDRVRRLSGASSDWDGVKLMSYAFAGECPQLIISDDVSEQEAAHLMFRGLFGYIRNPFHHKLIEHVSLERVIQILGMIDFLLLLVQNATQTQGQQDA